MNNGKKVSIKLNDLVVNPKNYRFNPVETEKQALKTMMDTLGMEVANLARDIAKNGLNPSRLPIVVNENGDFIVYDGNRRTTALKLLTNPDMIDSPYPLKQVFKSLKEEGYNPPTVLDVIVYDAKDAEVADRWVHIEHTGQNKGIGTVKWGSKETERFRSRHGKQIASKALQVTDYLEKKKFDTSKIDQTTLNRVISDPYIRKRVGVDFIKGELSVDDESFTVPKLKKIAKEMSKNSFKVRKVYSKDDRKAWIDKIDPTGNQKTDSKKKSKSKKKHQTKDKTYLGLIDPADSISEKLPKKIQDIHRELIGINVAKTPHATAALMRIYMELLTKVYLIQVHDYQEQVDKLVDASGKGNFSELKSRLGVVKNLPTVPKDIKGCITILLGKDLVTAHFNQVMHNTIFSATEHDNRSIWENLKKVMYYIASETSKK